MEDARFRTNSPPVVYETVEGETIVVNLETGSYYDLNEVGGYIFAAFERGASVADVARAVAAGCDEEPGVVHAAVGAFASRLTEEQLLIPAGMNGRAESAPMSAGPESPARFAEPALNKYTDMQELLLLDPVHEVSEAGWPSKA
jgi:hypothetical protein